MQFVENIKNIFKKISKTFFLFKNSSFKIFSPKKKKILIFDDVSAHIFKEILKDNDYYILKVRKCTLYLSILIKSILKYKNNWNLNNYLIDLINYVSPDIIFSFVDNNTFLWKIKNNLKKKTITFLIQNGYRNYAHDIFEYIDENKLDKNKFEVDYFGVFSETTRNFYSKYIKGEKLIIGSFRNNQVPVSINNNNSDILFISEFASKSAFNPKYSPKDYWYPENFFLPIIKEFAIKKHLKLKILGKLNNDRKLKNEEIEFYKKIIGEDNWEYLESNVPYESYKKIDKCKFVVFVSSTLGYESIARGKPTAALCSRNFKYNQHKIKNDYKFAWPSNMPDKGNFWTNDCEKGETLRILDFVNNISLDDWNILKENVQKSFMVYNKNNSLFLDKLRDLKIQTKNS